MNRIRVEKVVNVEGAIFGPVAQPGLPATLDAFLAGS
jgi:hypothetical protein